MARTTTGKAKKPAELAPCYIPCRIEPGMFREEFLVYLDAANPHDPEEAVKAQLLVDHRLEIHDARVVDEDVEAPEFLFRFVHRALRFGFDAEIGLDDERFGTALAYLLRDLFETITTSRRDRYFRAGARQHQRRRFADAG